MLFPGGRFEGGGVVFGFGCAGRDLRTAARRLRRTGRGVVAGFAVGDCGLYRVLIIGGFCWGCSGWMLEPRLRHSG